MIKSVAFFVLGTVLFAAVAIAQTIVYSDSFTSSQGSYFTTSGNIGSSSWGVTRSGDDWGARIDGGMMTLNNDAGAAAQANGWVYVSQTLANTGDFNNVFSGSSGLMTWSFNMRQIRTDPSGFASASLYGAAFVVGASSPSVATQGSGYAVVLGNGPSGAADPLRFVSFGAGLKSIPTDATGLIVAGAPLSAAGNAYMSIRLTYDPSGGVWELSGRDDGAAGFADPTSGALTSFGTVVNSTYTGMALTSGGAYWQGSTAAGQTAVFDNVRLQVVPEPSVCGLFGLAAAGFAAHLVCRHRM